MPIDHIRYDLLTQQALRAVVRRVLTDVAKIGALPGEHHFYISFDTRASGVRLSNRLREQYPDEMTIVLQHQFWDLTVTEAMFEVGLSFNGIAEKLAIPFDAIVGFHDPAVQFGLKFETVLEAQPDAPAEEPKGAKPRRKPDADDDAPAATGPAELAQEAVKESVQEAVRGTAAKRQPDKKETAKPQIVPPALIGSDKPEPDKPPGGAEVVRLDRFRKK